MAPLCHVLITGFFSPRPTKTEGDANILAVSLYGYANPTLTLFFVAPYRRKTVQNIRWMVAKIGLCEAGPSAPTVKKVAVVRLKF